MTAPFVILGTPRSRTAWLAKFLAFEGRKVLHEPSIDFRSINDLYALLQNHSVAGIVDSTMTFRWRDVLTAAPAARIVLVHRPPSDVIASFMRTGVFAGQRAAAQVRLGRLLRSLSDAIEDLWASEAVLSVPFEELNARHVCDRVFRYCLGEPMPERWWRILRAENVQADIRDVFRRAEANADGIRAVYPEIEPVGADAWQSR